MKRISLVLALAVLSASPAHAWLAQTGGPPVTSSSQIAHSQTITTQAAGLTRHYPIGHGGFNTTADTTVMTFAGTITSFIVRMTVPPTSTHNWVATLTKNGSDVVGFTCTINSASPDGACEATGSESFVAGNYMSLKIVSSASVAASRASASFEIQPATVGDTLIAARAGGAFSTGAQQALMAASSGSPSTLGGARRSLFPTGGTIDNLYVRSNAPGTTGSNHRYDYAVSINGTASGTLTCSIEGDQTSCNNTAAAPSVSAGADLAFAATPNNTPAGSLALFGLRFRPTTLGDYAHIFPGLGVGNSASATTYFGIVGGTTGAGGTTESDQQVVSHAQKICRIQVKLNTAPGAGTSRAYTLRVNGVDTALTVTISGTATEDGADAPSGCIDVAKFDLLSTSDVPTGSAAVSFPGISYLARR